MQNYEDVLKMQFETDLETYRKKFGLYNTVITIAKVLGDEDSRVLLASLKDRYE